MTSLQVDYWKLEETTRTNKANEGLRQGELNETVRHNQANEAIQWAQLGETSRHNQATENVSLYNAETERLSTNNWKAIQDANIALQRDSNDIQRERNRLTDLELVISQDRLLVDQQIRNRELDIKEEELKVKRSDNARKWVDSLISDSTTIFGEKGSSRSLFGWPSFNILG